MIPKEKILEIKDSQSKEYKARMRMVYYYRDPNGKEKARVYHKKWYQSLSKKQKKAILDKVRDYQRDYHRDYEKRRYHEDPKYRTMKLEAAKRYRQRKKK